MVVLRGIWRVLREGAEWIGEEIALGVLGAIVSVFGSFTTLAAAIVAVWLLFPRVGHLAKAYRVVHTLRRGERPTDDTVLKLRGGDSHPKALKSLRVDATALTLRQEGKTTHLPWARLKSFRRRRPGHWTFWDTEGDPWQIAPFRHPELDDEQLRHLDSAIARRLARLPLASGGPFGLQRLWVRGGTLMAAGLLLDALVEWGWVLRALR